jgi:hypothetical protein
MTSSGKGSRPKRASTRSKRSAPIAPGGSDGPKGDFEELFACFNARQVRYLIVGGYAVAFHAKPRYTKDIDLLIERSSKNATRVLAALEDFVGSALPQLERADFLDPDGVLVLGVAPNRVDILNAIPGVEFTQSWKRRVESRYGRELVFFISRADLLRNKELVGRPVDKRDAEWLRRAAARTVGGRNKTSSARNRPVK